MRTLGELLGFWRSQGLEGTLASAVAASGGGGGGGVLHWVRTGLLCCAVVTSEAQLQVCEWGWAQQVVVAAARWGAAACWAERATVFGVGGVRG